MLPWLGMEQPGMYSMELTLLVLEAGIKLLRERRPELLYLSLTDWVQHKWAPDEDGAREFYRGSMIASAAWWRSTPPSRSPPTTA